MIGYRSESKSYLKVTIKVPNNTTMANAVDPMITCTDFPSLRAHLETQYNIVVSRITQLDRVIFWIDRQEGPSWIARVLESSCPIEVVEGDTEILRFLERLGFPAERCANPSSIQ